VFNTSLGLHSAKGDLKVLTVYPNPSSQLLNIAFESENNAAIRIMITDAQGSVVKQIERYHQLNNLFKESIDCSDLSVGLYQVSIHQNNQTYTQRIVIGN
jgi:hypothetical protein